MRQLSEDNNHISTPAGGGVIKTYHVKTVGRRGGEYRRMTQDTRGDSLGEV